MPNLQDIGIPKFLMDLLNNSVFSQGKVQLEKRWKKEAVAITNRANREGVTIEKVGVRGVVRFTLYWLCKSVVKSGTLADLWRDYLDDKVIAAVQGEGSENREKVILLTVKHTLELIF